MLKEIGLRVMIGLTCYDDDGNKIFVKDDGSYICKHMQLVLVVVLTQECLHTSLNLICLGLFERISGGDISAPPYVFWEFFWK